MQDSGMASSSSFMMFLASSFADSANEFQDRVKEGRVLFIDDAADPFEGPKPWVRDDITAFEDRGFDITPFSIKYSHKLDLNRALRSVEIVHFAGGSAIYLLRLLRDKGMADVLVGAIKRGVIYTGSSAGSMIMAPSIEFCCDDPDESDVGQWPIAGGGCRGSVHLAEHLKGLDMVPFYMICHNQDPEYAQVTSRAFARAPEEKNPLPILCLNDGQAVWVDDQNRFEIVDSKRAR